MPKQWCYFIALVLPLAFRVLLLNTNLVDWVWYEGYTDEYDLLNRLRVAPYFLQFIGGWPLPVFIMTVISYWMMDDGESIPDQFLLLPLAYVPFTILGDILLTGELHTSNFFIHPLIIIPVGYVYIFIWVAFIWILEKLKLVL